LQITGGKFKGQKLFTPSSKSLEIRPLRSRIRKALFDIIGNNLEGQKVLDLFAGTGALGIEALSRSADLVIFVDSSPQSIELIKKNLNKLRIDEKAIVLKLKLPEGFENIVTLSINSKLLFDIVFVTPPYEKGLSLKTLERLPTEILKEDTLIVVEERDKVYLPERMGNFQLLKKKTYGETALFFYKIEAPLMFLKGNR
jgi:16S rRNA (guanine966-N2)-methyltransferase